MCTGGTATPWDGQEGMDRTSRGITRGSVTGRPDLRLPYASDWVYRATSSGWLRAIDGSRKTGPGLCAGPLKLRTATPAGQPDGGAMLVEEMG